MCIRDSLWAALRTTKGYESRDAAWAHPDLVPTSADLDDPLGYVDRGHPVDPSPTHDLDAELAKLLESERGKDDQGSAE